MTWTLVFQLVVLIAVTGFMIAFIASEVGKKK